MGLPMQRRRRCAICQHMPLSKDCFVRIAALQAKAMPAFSGGPLPHRLSLRKAFTCFAKLSVTSL